MQKPINKDIYNVIKSFEDGQTPGRTVEEFYENDKKFLLIYERLQSEKYLSIQKRERIVLKKEYKDEIDRSYCGEETITIDGKEAPLEWFDKKDDHFVTLTDEGKIFLLNYSNFWKKLNYWLEDYHIIMPILFGFLGGIISSLIIYFITGR